MSAIDIYAIPHSDSTELLLLHHITVELHPRGISRPLVGRDGIYLLGIHDLRPHASMSATILLFLQRLRSSGA